MENTTDNTIDKIPESVFTMTDQDHIIEQSDFIKNASLPEEFDLDSTYNIAIYG